MSRPFMKCLIDRTESPLIVSALSDDRLLARHPLISSAQQSQTTESERLTLRKW